MDVIFKEGMVYLQGVMLVKVKSELVHLFDFFYLKVKVATEKIVGQNISVPVLYFPSVLSQNLNLQRKEHLLFFLFQFFMYSSFFMAETGFILNLKLSYYLGCQWLF